jgi:hypothetical protein
MKFSYTKKLRFILLGAYFKKRAELPISQERPADMKSKSTGICKKHIQEKFNLIPNLGQGKSDR